MYRFALLFDKKNDWLKKYLPDDLNFRKDIEVSNFYEEQNIKQFDVVFVLGFTRILNKEFLQANDQVLIVHESNLPLGKGFSPLQWQILEGKDKIFFPFWKLQKNLIAVIFLIKLS